MAWKSYEDLPGTPQDLESGATWRNWGQTQSATPAEIFHPESVDDLKAIVKRARNEGKRVRVCGDGHSWSALVPTTDFMVFVSKLDNVVVDKSDPGRPRVTMEAGATVRKVLQAMRAARVALPSNVVLGSVQYGGLIATGCHGSGRDVQTLSDLVTSMDIVTGKTDPATGDVEVRTFSVDHGTPEELMSAARLNLGTFGIIHRMTLQVVPEYNVETIDKKLPTAVALDTIRDTVGAFDYTELFWFPFNDRVWLKTMRRTPNPRTHDEPVDGLRALLNLVDAQLGELGFEAVVANPKLARLWGPLAFNLVPERQETESIIDGLHYQQAINRLRMGNLEIAFAVDKDFANFKQAWTQVVDLVEQCAARDEYPMNMAMNARFIKGSNVLLAPSAGNPHGADRYTCYIEILSYYRTPGWAEFEAHVGDQWMNLQNARPHWAKTFESIPHVVERIHAAYGDRITRFLDLRRSAGVDPDDTFLNPLLARLFGDA
jgi:hypothetical protein